MADGQEASAVLTADTTDASASGHDPSQEHENSTTAIADPREQHSAENRVPSYPLVNEVNIYIHENDSEHREEVEERNASFVQETAEVLNANDIKATENCIETTPSDSNLSLSEGSECQKCCEVGEHSRRDLSWNEKLLTLLECPVCLNSMIPPISLCINGHNICNSCESSLISCPICRGRFLKVRNVALEKVARELNLPCRNSECTNLKSHHPTCIYQPLYSCPFTQFTKCGWQGHFTKIREHMETEHAGRIFYDIHTYDWPLSLVVRDFKIIFALGAIFLYKLKLKPRKSRFYVQVFNIGPVGNHRNFIYSLFLSSKKCKQKISYYNSVLSMDDLEQNCTYDLRNCIVLDYYDVVKLSVEGDIEYWLKLSRREGV